MTNKHWYHIKNEVPQNGIVEVYIDNEIGEFGIPARQFLNELKQHAGAPITLHINSPGGSLIDAFAIYDFVKLQQYNLTAHISGIAASAATVVSMAAKQVFMGAHSYFFIHNPFYADGRADRGTDLEKMKQDIIAIYQQKTGLAAEQLSAMMDAETLLSAREAFDLGFVDGISYEQPVAANIRQHLSKLPDKVAKQLKQDNATGGLLDTVLSLTEEIKVRLAAKNRAKHDSISLETSRGDVLLVQPEAKGSAIYNVGDAILTSFGQAPLDGSYQITDGNTIRINNSFINQIQKTIVNMEQTKPLETRLEELIGQLTTLLQELNVKADPEQKKQADKDQQIENLQAELQRIKAQKLDVKASGSDKQPMDAEATAEGGWNYISRFLQNRYR